MKCTVQEAQSPEKISSGSVAGRDLIPALKGLNITSKIMTCKPADAADCYGVVFHRPNCGAAIKFRSGV
jgi:hypothetical protein